MLSSNVCQAIPGFYLEFFVWGGGGGGVDPKKFLEPRSSAKKSFSPSRVSGGMLPRKILKR